MTEPLGLFHELPAISLAAFALVAVAADGTVFMTDFGNNRVQKWRPGVKE